MRSALLSRSSRMLWVALVTAALTLVMASPSSARVVDPVPLAQKDSSVAAAAKNTSLTCAKKAMKKAKKNKKYKYWVCLGSKAKYLKRKKPKPNPAAAAAQPAMRNSVSVQDADPDDSRCELVPACRNIRTLWLADIKANALYGHNDEIWGAFDVIYTQSFSGASSRYRLKLIWDYGYAIDSQWWTAQVRRNLTGLPDPTTGVAYFYPDRISVNGWTQVDPSFKGFKSTEPTKHKGKQSR